MPTYEYECDKCGIRFERLQGIMDKPVGKCPECGGPVRRLIGTGAGIIFKGKGFYQTDYKSTCAASDRNTGKDGKAPDCSSCPHNK